MPRLLLNAEDLAKVRVSTSWGPFTEVLLSLRSLRSRRASGLFDGWRHAVQAQVGPETALLHALAPASLMIDLHTVVGEAPTIDEALAGLESAPVEHVRSELAYLPSANGGIPAWAQSWIRDLSDGDRQARRELVTRVNEYYQHAVAPYWSSVRRYLDAEGMRRARIMAEGGVDRLLATLHPRVHWRPPFLDVDHAVGARCSGSSEASESSEPDESLGLAGGREQPEPLVPDGRSLVLVPAVFDLDGPHLLSNAADETQPYLLLYPALRDVDDAAALWTPQLSSATSASASSAASRNRALAMLLGHTRARALEAIADTCTTTELAQRIRVSPPTASHHVSVLRAAGLVASRRTGSAVLHHVTARGAILLGD